MPFPTRRAPCFSPQVPEASRLRIDLRKFKLRMTFGRKKPMTAVSGEETLQMVQRLIQSCEEAHQGFQLAAEAAEDAILKRLFNIYAQQRSRFAQELGEYGGSADGESHVQSTDWILTSNKTDRELLGFCLDADQQSLNLYREAMQKRCSRKAHFLISAQFALMQRSHERMRELWNEDSKPTGRACVTTERAML